MAGVDVLDTRREVVDGGPEAGRGSVGDVGRSGEDGSRVKGERRGVVGGVAMDVIIQQGSYFGARARRAIRPSLCTGARPIAVII